MMGIVLMLCSRAIIWERPTAHTTFPLEMIFLVHMCEAVLIVTKGIVACFALEWCWRKTMACIIYVLVPGSTS